MTKEINLSLSYLSFKKSIYVFFVAVALGQMINIVNLYFMGVIITIKQLLFQMSSFIIMMLIPEIVSFLGIIYTLRGAHEIFKIKKLKMTANSVAIYEFKLVLIILISYFIYFPLTFGVRFLCTGRIAEFIATFKDLPFYNIKFFILYLFPILFVGLILTNISLFFDVLKSNKESLAKEEIKKLTLEFEEKNQEKGIKEKLLPVKVLKIKEEWGGFRDLSTSDIIYFQYTEDKSRQVLFYHLNGTSTMRMSLAEIENEIISLGNFYRINRRIIVNFDFIEEYLIDSETKKMTLKLNGASLEPDVSRYRLIDFKKAHYEFKLSKQMSV